MALVESAQKHWEVDAQLKSNSCSHAKELDEMPPPFVDPSNTAITYDPSLSNVALSKAGGNGGGAFDG
jgi:hypothetical protein